MRVEKTDSTSRLSKFKAVCTTSSSELPQALWTNFHIIVSYSMESNPISSYFCNIENKNYEKQKTHFFSSFLFSSIVCIWTEPFCLEIRRTGDCCLWQFRGRSCTYSFEFAQSWCRVCLFYPHNCYSRKLEKKWVFCIS